MQIKAVAGEGSYKSIEVHPVKGGKDVGLVIGLLFSGPFDV